MRGVLLVAALGLFCAAAFAQEAVEVRLSRNGEVTVKDAGDQVARIATGFAIREWQFHDQGGARAAKELTAAGTPQVATLGLGGNQGEVEFSTTVDPEPRGFRLRVLAKPSAALPVNSVHLGLGLPAGAWAGAAWEAGTQSGVIPLQGGPTMVFAGEAPSLTLQRPGGCRMTLTPSGAAGFLLQDSRQWGPMIDIRVSRPGFPGDTWQPGQQFSLDLRVEFDRAVNVVFEGPTTVQAGPEWIPLTGALDIVPGSALDWSGQGIVDPPAGKDGRLVVSPEGRFVFEGQPGKPVRFYGVNLCFSSCYPTHEVADRVATRLRMLGYNAVRIHHYESQLCDQSDPAGLTLRPAEQDRIDYLLAALKKNGIYITTDLYVSRPVAASVVFPGATGMLGMDEMKMLVPVSDAAFANLAEFVRRFLGHENTYLGHALKDDPVLITLSLLNEDNAGNYVDGLPERTAKLWTAAWDAWLLERYGDRAKLAEAWRAGARVLAGAGNEGLGDAEDPATGTVRLTSGPGRRGVDHAIFLAQTQRRMFDRVKAFLRDELGCRALLTDLNSWTDNGATMAIREGFDLVDGHFYWDHPNFLENPWQLPSRGWSNGDSAVSAGGAGARDRSLLRVFGKPFTITEFNCPAPNAYRSELGPLMGAVSGLQGWDGIFRFAYSHNGENMSNPSPCNYFDLAADPLNLASDRAAILLFLRGDVRMAPHSVAVRTDPKQMLGAPERMPGVDGPLTALALVTRVGSALGAAQGDLSWAVLPGLVKADMPGDPHAANAPADTIAKMRELGWLASKNRTDVATGVVESETGEIALEPRAGRLVVATERTVAVFSKHASGPVDAGPLHIEIGEPGGAVWVTSLDGRPLSSSGRILVAHLTDVQNSGAKFADLDRVTLEAWGGMPQLARKGTAKVTIPRQGGVVLRAWALGLDGARVGQANVRTENGSLVLDADTQGPKGGCLYYELAPE